MRKRVFVLYYSKLWQSYNIVTDKTTPLYKLRKLDHCVGVYRSRKEAANEAISRLASLQNHFMQEITRMRKESRRRDT